MGGIFLFYRKPIKKPLIISGQAQRVFARYKAYIAGDLQSVAGYRDFLYLRIIVINGIKATTLPEDKTGFEFRSSASPA